MFWSLNYGGTSAIDTILNSEEGYTLEQLLDEEDLLQELKSQNSKLLDFLTKPETMQQLIKYIIELPDEASSEERSYKYPYVASEVLSSDVPLLRGLLLHVQTMRQLFSIFEQPPPLAPVLAGYCSKVVVSLFKSSPDSFLYFFYELWSPEAEEADESLSVSHLLSRLLLHLGSDAVLNMLTVLCVGEPMPAEPGMMQSQPPSTSPWLPHPELVPGLLDNLICDDPESAQNSAQLLCSVVDGTPGLPGCLCEPEEEARQRCASLVAACFGGGPPEEWSSLHLPALDVLLRVLARCREMRAIGQPGCAAALFDAVGDGVDCFFIALATPAPLPARIRRFIPERAVDALPRPQAPQRCKLLALFEEALRAESAPILEALEQLGFYQVVIDLLILPHNCNAVHIQSTKILEVTLEMRGDFCVPLSKALLVDAQLPQRIAEYCSEAAAKPIRASCHAFVMSLANTLRDKSAQERGTAEGLEVLNAALESSEGWAGLVAAEGPLAAWNTLHAKPLGGRLPARSDGDEDSEDDYDPSREVENVLAAQALASRMGAMGMGLSGDSSGAGLDEDDEDDEAGDYLQHLANIVNPLRTDFVNPLRDELDAALQASASADDGQWSAEFELDDGGADFDVRSSEPKSSGFDGGDFPAFDIPTQPRAPSEAAGWDAFGAPPSEAAADATAPPDFAAFDAFETVPAAEPPAAAEPAPAEAEAEPSPVAFEAAFDDAPPPSLKPARSDNEMTV